MSELWKDILGYEGRYQVSNQGRVKSLSATVICFGPVKGQYTSKRKGKILRPGRMPGGHLSVALGRGNSRCVHELVLIAFVGCPGKGQECRHINGEPSNNYLENLAWGTRRENILDAVGHGTWMTTARIDALNKGRLTRWGGQNG